jgi:transcriptional regulator with XRE-family HTH domain
MPQAPDLLKQARSAAGLTQAGLASRLAISQSEIARLESRRSNPRLATLLRAIEATGHTVELTLRPKPTNVDESMLAANLELSPADRLDRFGRAYRSVATLAARARADGP